ncbi:hypothetical protein [Corallococcus macrosporus]|uniref:Uncharacterized protein n=1 Tax=Corallococcus macrosporus DSM 14697 TaxID=1189310 RepID=A0A250K4B3_9BACT|nr:hypothetical protein [Corallococcus macrosporus]ATB50924.1 hypothetical protein MYMAC_006581 [Corallococcus macrosporus DSM 14697]
MTLGLATLGLFTALLSMAAIFPVHEPKWFGFGLLAAALCALGGAFSGPHLRTAMPWGVGTGLAIWALVGLGTGGISAWLGWAALGLGLAFLTLGLLHFMRRVVSPRRLPRFLHTS